MHADFLHVDLHSYLYCLQGNQKTIISELGSFNFLQEFMLFLFSKNIRSFIQIY